MSNISLKNNNIELNAILETVNSLSSGKEEQEKSIEITENGTTEITPDDGKTFSKVSITTNVEGVGEDVAEERSKWINRSWTEFNDNEVTKLGSFAFGGCSSLTTVNLPVCNYVGSYAFQNCTSLSSIDLPMCSYIDGYAFQRCSSLSSVNLPVCSIVNAYAFGNCSSLTSIDLPICGGIGAYAFNMCSSLISVNLPMCIRVSGYAFQKCTSLTSVNLPVCTTIDGSVFCNCTSLSIVNLPVCSSITYGTFSGCTSLTSLTLGYSSVARLGGTNAFKSTPMSVSTLTGTFGSIYVPASLVDAYKSATNWVTYADRITAIVE